MADPLRGLSESDVAILREVLSWAKQQGLNARGRFPRERTHAEGDDQAAPEVYVAKTPSGGIPALEECSTGTGSAGCIEGTGTGTGDGYDEPGSAECDLYAIDMSEDIPDLKDFGKDITVYNVFSSAFSGDAYLPVVRDKWGRWLAVGGGGGNALIRFEVLAAGPSLGTGVTECDYVTGKVLSTSCQGASVSIDDEVLIWDPGSCQFNIPIEVLIGTQGWAIKVTNTHQDAVDCSDENSAAGACRWEVQALCCGEEIYGS